MTDGAYDYLPRRSQDQAESLQETTLAGDITAKTNEGNDKFCVTHLDDEKISEE